VNRAADFGEDLWWPRHIWPPRREAVVVAGHSAGGQFTNRYAATSRVGADISVGPAYRFVVSNPSSYLYLDSRRYHAEVLTSLTATETAACSGYDSYKYGLRDPYSYLRDNDPSAVLSRYRARRVVYLLGGADTSTNDASLDTACEAEWQGSQRLERGQLFFRYLAGFYCSQVTVPAVGHDAKGMYTSSEGAAALFP
jgi:pimeloyl-ACP methyl ester carboxylesterase